MDDNVRKHLTRDELIQLQELEFGSGVDVAGRIAARRDPVMDEIIRTDIERKAQERYDAYLKDQGFDPPIRRSFFY